MDLTEEGFKHTNEIISVIFAYLRMVSRSGVPDYIFQELEQLSQINFDYAGRIDVFIVNLLLLRFIVSSLQRRRKSLTMSQLWQPACRSFHRLDNT